jgi:hypothetical protein
MTIIKDLNELHISLKSFIIGLAFLMPFCYIDVYLFNPKLITEEPIQIGVVLSFCFSFVLLLFNLSFIATLRIKQANKSDVGLLFTLAPLFSIVILIFTSIAMSIAGGHIRQVIEYSILASVVLFVLAFIYYLVAPDKKK